MTQIPGTQVTAAWITPECGRNRGVEGAWEEAVARLRKEYESVLDGWRDLPGQPTMNLVLTMERPTGNPDTTPPSRNADERDA